MAMFPASEAFVVWCRFAIRDRSCALFSIEVMSEDTLLGNFRAETDGAVEANGTRADVVEGCICVVVPY
jgi:hypothetical protein